MKPDVSAMAVALLLGTPAAVWSQVGKPTAEEAKLSAIDVPGGPAFKSDGLSKEPGLTDPRDFTGTWNSQRGTSIEGFLARRAAEAAGQATDRPANFAATMRAQQTAKLACIPSGGVASGGDGPVEIVQTADQLTWMAEEMHAIRRIFLKGNFTPDLQPSYNGEAIGHFEGNTLVVETRGMKSLAPGVRMLERMSKSEAGRMLENQISYVDADGKPVGNPRTLQLYYRPNEKMMEWICEDNGQIYQPGVYGRDL